MFEVFYFAKLACSHANQVIHVKNKVIKSIKMLFEVIFLAKFIFM